MSSGVTTSARSRPLHRISAGQGLEILDDRLRASIALAGRWPRLDRHLRTSNPGVFMAGYPAEGQYGPLSRFVEGTRFAAPRIAAGLS